MLWQAGRGSQGAVRAMCASWPVCPDLGSAYSRAVPPWNWRRDQVRLFSRIRHDFPSDVMQNGRRLHVTRIGFIKIALNPRGIHHAVFALLFRRASRRDRISDIRSAGGAHSLLVQGPGRRAVYVWRTGLKLVQTGSTRLFENYQPKRPQYIWRRKSKLK